MNEDIELIDILPDFANCETGAEVRLRFDNPPGSMVSGKNFYLQTKSKCSSKTAAWKNIDQIWISKNVLLIIKLPTVKYRS